jgi:hypothetical protein
MKLLKFIALSLFLSSFFLQAQAQDTTRKTTIISSDTTVIRKDSSNARKANAAKVAQTPAAAPAPAAAAPAAAPASPATSGGSDDYPQVGFHLGFRFQPGFAAFSSSSNSNAVGFSGRVGYGYGISLAYYFNNYWGTQLELMYSTLSQDVQETKTGFTRTINLNYISIPILATLNTNYGKPVNFNIALGPQFGLLAGSSVSSNGNGNFSAGVAAKGMDLGVAFGGGLDFALGPKHHTHINVGYRGVQGLIDIDNSGGVQSNSNYYVIEKAKTASNNIYLGIMFKL